jgi:hypothetical protein
MSDSAMYAPAAGIARLGKARQRIPLIASRRLMRLQLRHSPLEERRDAFSRLVAGVDYILFSESMSAEGRSKGTFPTWPGAALGFTLSTALELSAAEAQEATGTVPAGPPGPTG